MSKLLSVPKMQTNWKHKVVIPAGDIDDRGQSAVKEYLRYELGSNPSFLDVWRKTVPYTYAFSMFRETLEEKIGWEWVNKSGKWPKRFNKEFHKLFGVALPESLMGRIGDLASGFCVKEDTEFVFDFTHKLDWKPGQFSDHDSCYWGCRELARVEMLPRADFFAIRLFNPVSGKGLARAWVAPACFNGRHFYIVFNSYGFDARDMARLLSTHLQTDYKKISLYNNGTASGMMWINGGMGYAVGDKNLIEGITTWDFKEPEPWRICNDCHKRMEPGTEYQAGGDLVCQDCIDAKYVKCGECGEYHLREYSTYVSYYDAWVCNPCLSYYYKECDHCSKWIRFSDLRECVKHGGAMNCCTECYDKLRMENDTVTLATDAWG